MTDSGMEEIWQLITAALSVGRKRFYVHVFPFRMTPENLASRQNSALGAFWRDLERGLCGLLFATAFGVCSGRYIVTPSAGGHAGGHEIANSCINLTGNKG